MATPSGKPSVVLVEDKTGAPIETISVHRKDGRPLTFHHVRFAPGPGATLNTHKVIADRNARVLGQSVG
jgi:hypothetical protein